MKIALDQQYENADGSPAIDNQNGEPVMLKHILVQVCLSGAAPPAEKVRRYALYKSITKSKVGYVQLEADDVKLFKEAIVATHPTLIVGQTHEMLDREYFAPAAANGALTRNPDDYRDIPDA